MYKFPENEKIKQKRSIFHKSGKYNTIPSLYYFVKCYGIKIKPRWYECTNAGNSKELPTTSRPKTPYYYKQIFMQLLRCTRRGHTAHRTNRRYDRSANTRAIRRKRTRR